jgi:hypothetical protein
MFTLTPSILPHRPGPGKSVCFFLAVWRESKDGMVMAQTRYRPLFAVLGCLCLAWILAIGGYQVFRNSRVTPEKVRAYLRSVDLAKLSPEERRKALRELIAKLNKLSYEERRTARLDNEWGRWFQVMTDEEKGEFIEGTLPTGVKQMLASFEELPEARRKKMIDDALKRLREAREQIDRGEVDLAMGETGQPPVLSDELRQKITTTGLKTYYGQSSAQMKAEMAPLLEEMQRMMERGAFFRGH